MQEKEAGLWPKFTGLPQGRAFPCPGTASPSYLRSVTAQHARQADGSQARSLVEGNASVCDQYQA